MDSRIHLCFVYASIRTRQRQVQYYCWTTRRITVDQFNAGLQAIAPKTEANPEYIIIHSYSEEGKDIDVVAKFEDNKLVDCRLCWIEEDLGDIAFCLEASDGTTVTTRWKRTTKNNRWLNAYRRLWTERNDQRVKRLEEIARAEVDQEEIAFIQSLEAAMYA